MKTLTVMGADGNLHNITLTWQDIMAMQTKESKRTMVIGVTSMLASVASMVMPKGVAKYAAMATGGALAIVSAVSANNAMKKATNQENLDRINAVLRDVCTREGFEYCC